MFDFSRGQWHPDKGALAELVMVLVDAAGQRIKLRTNGPALLLHANKDTASYLAPNSEEVFAAGDLLLLFRPELMHVTFERILVGRTRELSFRAALLVANPLLLAHWLRDAGVSNLIPGVLTETLTKDHGVQQALQDVVSAPRGNLSTVLGGRLREPLLALSGLRVDSVSGASIHEAPIIPRELIPGALVDHRLRLIQPLGAGAFGEVWLAEHADAPGLNRALKFVRDRETARWVRREMERLVLIERSPIDYRHVARLMDVLSGDTPCLVYEYIEGRSLHQYITDRGGTLPTMEAVALARQILAGLNEVHRAGLIHRDLHPGNLMVVGDDSEPLVKILDFGLAWPKGGADQSSGYQSGLSIEPTHPFAEPTAQRRGPPDERTDLFSVGVLLSWMLSGQTGMFELPAMSSSEPLSTWKVIESACVLPRARRYATADDMEKALREVSGLSDEDQTLDAWPDGLPDIPVIFDFFEQEEQDGGPVNAAAPIFYQGLETAIEQADPGDTITLKSGTYQLQDSLLIDKPLTIVGAGMDNTRIVCASDECVLQYTGAGTLAVRDVELMHEGSVAANVVSIFEDDEIPTEVEFLRCRFTGAVFDDKSSGGSAGLAVFGSIRGIVSACEAVNNQGNGILLQGGDELRIEGNRCADNSEAGIAYYSGSATVQNNQCTCNAKDGIECADSAMGLIVGNQCIKNGRCGIWVHGTVRPEVVENICNNNHGNGITYEGNATGRCRRNDCSENDGQGIWVDGSAEPELIENTCRRNKNPGIFYLSTASSLIRGNTVSDGEMNGIIVAQLATPVLEDNIIERNQYNGIVYLWRAGGVARGNICRENGGCGINAEGSQGKFEFCSNQCIGNKFSGIYMSGNARGTVEDNTCNDNGSVGIFLADDACVVLEANTCLRNVIGIRLGGRKVGSVANSHCCENQWHGMSFGDNTSVTVQSCDCSRNQKVGLGFWEEASGRVFETTCHRNEHDGIYVNSSGRVTIFASICSGNNESGIFCDAGLLDLRDNACEENGNGFLFLGTATGRVWRVTAQRSRWHGIYVGGAANPSIHAALSAHNTQCGIFFCDHGKGEVDECSLTGNGFDGIAVEHQASPDLRANRSEQNGGHGIGIYGTACGNASKNTCRGNRHYGVYVAASASPILGENECEGNLTGNMLDRRAALSLGS